MNAPIAETCLWKNADFDITDPRLAQSVAESQKEVGDPWLSVNERQLPVLRIWKVKSRRAIHLPKEDYGHFYQSTVYILLNERFIDPTHNKRNWHIHLWIGRTASQDDYVTGIYLCTQLDHKLGMEAIIHREVESLESALFMECFPENTVVTVWKGSHDQCYNECNRQQKSYPARLIQVYRPKEQEDTYRAREVLACTRMLEPNSYFILDRGTELTLWFGGLSSTSKAQKVISYVQNLKANRACMPSFTSLNDSGTNDTTHPFYAYLSKESYVRGEEILEDKTIEKWSTRRFQRGATAQLIKMVIKKAGTLEMRKIKDGNITLKDLEKNHVNILDSPNGCFIWSSKKATIHERVLSLQLAHMYLKGTKFPLLPVTVLKQGHASAEFEAALLSRHNTL